MTPTIVERTESFYDRWFPWRSTIITSVLQTILNVYEYNFSMQEVNAPISPSMVTDLITFEPNTFNTNLRHVKSKRLSHR
jgi:gamma-glutamyltranspeptidase/glutathione hydrolase